ncbi:MAG: cupin domain-containing protein [Sphingomicrobium sp.]
MPKIDLDTIEQTCTTGYPPPFDRDVAGRHYRRLGPAFRLTDFGVSEVTLDPGAWSSQRHWHDGEDEFLVMIDGEAVMIEDEGRTIMRSGDMVAWAKGVRNGHHLVNESDTPCRFVVVGGGKCTWGEYSDIDMTFNADGRYRRKDGTPYSAPPSS